MQVKYMGSANERRLEEGDDFGGRVSEALSVDLVFNQDNNWVIDTSAEEYESVDASVWEFLTETFPEEFLNVTKYKRVPLNVFQTQVLGLTEGEQKTVAQVKAEHAEREAALLADIEASNAQVDAEDEVPVSGETSESGGRTASPRKRSGSK